MPASAGSGSVPVAEPKCSVCGGPLRRLNTGEAGLWWCETRCRTVYNPPVYPVMKGSNLTKADLLGPENYESLRSAGDYGQRSL